VALTVFVGAVFLTWSYGETRRETGRLESQIARLREQSASLPIFATFVLTPERLRSRGGDQLQIPTGARWIELRVELPEVARDSSIFAAALSTAEGQEICGQKGLSRSGSSVEIDLPASLLPRGDYVLSLTAVDGTNQKNLPSYQFRIDR